MKTLRYLLIAIGVLSVVGVAAATFGTPYQPQRRGAQYTQTYSEMPTLSMGSTGSAMMSSGSVLPMAAVTGTTTTDQTSPSGGPRRIGGNTSGGSENREDPFVDPIGDAVLPLMLFACAYFIWRATRKRRVKTLNG